MANRRRRNDAAQPRAMVPPTRHVTMEDVLKHKPSKFSGKANEVNAWLKECEKIFKVLACTEAQQLTFTNFLLVGDAEYWYTGMQQQMQTRQEEVNWANFRTRFLEKYFPDSAKHALEAEFLTLQQGNRSVQAYVDRFEYLPRFYSQEITEEWHCRKFKRGLKHEL